MSALDSYLRLRRRQGIAVALLLVVLVAVLLFSLALGAAPVIWSDLLDGQSPSYSIVSEIRLPRSLAAIAAGAVLGVSGLVMQNVLRNPMASPFTLGVSGAAAFGAAAAIVLLPTPSGLLVQLSAFAASILCVSLVLAVARARGMRPAILVLAGIMLNALFSAGTAALQYLADDQKVAEILFWSFGDLNRANLRTSLCILAVLAIALLWLFGQRWNFALLATGDEHAQASGLAPQKFRMHCLFLTALLTATVVAQFGTIAFVGLVVPHIARALIRDEGPWLLPATLLVGGIFLLGSASLAQHAFNPIIMPVGIVTAFCGAPFFLSLLLLRKEG